MRWVSQLPTIFVNGSITELICAKILSPIADDEWQLVVTFVLIMRPVHAEEIAKSDFVEVMNSANTSLARLVSSFS